MVAFGARRTRLCSRFTLCALHVYDLFGRPGPIDRFTCRLLLAPQGEERIGDVSNVLFTNGWIADEDGTVFIYYASSDTRMHVATSTVDKLVDYCLHTPEDGLSSSASVATLSKLIEKNLAVLNQFSLKNSRFVL